MRRLVFILCMVGIGCGGYLSLGFLSEAQNLTTQSYVVQYGDTLWDIAGKYLGNPQRWREIHQNNPFITNPNLIYPGDILGISTGLAGPSKKRPEGEIVGKKLSEKPIARPWYGMPAPTPEKVRLPAIPGSVVASTDFLEALGYLVPYSLDQLQAAQFGQITGTEYGKGETNARVIDSETGRPGLIFGDIIYINRGTAQKVREGDVFLAFRPTREIRHPITSELLGTQIEILGRVRVKTLEPDVSCAEIIRSYNYIEVGDPIIPIAELSLPLQKPLVGNSRSYGFKVGNQLIGHIIAGRIGVADIGQQLLGDGDIVFIDVGAAQGIQPADNFIVFREPGKGYPKQALGRLTVLSVQKQTAMALVTESVKAFEPGEKIALMP